MVVSKCSDHSALDQRDETFGDIVASPSAPNLIAEDFDGAFHRLDMLVRTLSGYRIKDVDDSDNLGDDGDRVSAESIGVP